MTYSRDEFLITAIARLLEGDDVRHVAVGAASPIPGAAALLVRNLKGGSPRMAGAKFSTQPGRGGSTCFS